MILQQKLQEVCRSNVMPSFPLHSRVHKMQEMSCYVKREDELGFGISGSKLRKYASLLPFLKKTGKCVALLGSPYSNHVLSFLQLLKQEAIPFRVFLEKPREISPKGNFFLLSLMLQKKEVVWIEKAPNLLTPEWTEKMEKEVGQEFLWIPVGGAMEESLSGALTLPLDIIENEKQLGCTFDHIFVDAGTGTSAAALILGMAYLQKKTKIHVVLIGGSEESFCAQLSLLQSAMQKLLKEEVLVPEDLFRLLFPPTAKSFGSSNASVFEIIVKTAQKEGFFLDPIYTAKLLLTVKKEALPGNVLWIHSGGALSLFGFQDSLLRYCEDIPI